MKLSDMDCYACESNSGEKRISPGPTIFEGKYWFVEHAYPTSLKGWLVIVAKRHIESLHELTHEEFIEYNELCEKAILILRQTVQCEKEYVMCFAEAEHFQHIHFHVVPKPSDLLEELKGAKIFALLKVDENSAVPPKVVQEFCEVLKSEFSSILRK